MKMSQRFFCMIAGVNCGIAGGYKLKTDPGIAFSLISLSMVMFSFATNWGDD